eukprot:GEMP01077301.1.p1 GENE.GEMP01077301.1~~GEMP01077301.1.p1  ORF type:complete len:117 (+),score=17.43 GEMP01077301.1:31-381(+)
MTAPESMTELRKRKEEVTATPDDPSASGTTNQDVEEKICPISGKAGNCPMASLLPVGAKSITGKSKKSTDDKNDSILWSLCPVHMDTTTLKIFSIVALVAWAGGFAVGFFIRGYFF